STVGRLAQLLAPDDAVVRGAQARLQMAALPARFAAGPALGEVGGEVVGDAVREVDALARLVGMGSSASQLRLPESLRDACPRDPDHVVESSLRVAPLGENLPRERIELAPQLRIRRPLNEGDDFGTAALFE